jgi:hypothetical protein
VSRRTAYLVQRYAVDRGEGREELAPWPVHNRGWPDPSEMVPLRLFDRREQAEEHCRVLKRAAQAFLNPFALLGPYLRLDLLTSLRDEVLRDQILLLGLMPPVEEWPDWAAWWRQTASLMTEEQRDGLWALLDKARLYEVTAVELED